MEAVVEVDTIFPPTKRPLEMYPAPWTEKRSEGEVVPIPTLPASAILTLSVKTAPAKDCFVEKTKWFPAPDVPAIDFICELTP